jgi:TonB-dependent SusC/RagA subfamily outer membrane receptor
MKLVSTFLILSLVALHSAFGQQKLTKSKTSGDFTYVYKLTDQETYSIASKGTSVISDQYLHTLVDSFYNDKGISTVKKLSFGNYLQVKAVKSNLVYTLNPVNNVHLNFVNNQKDFQFSLTDLKGKPLEDAKVTVDQNKTAKYNAQANVYESRSKLESGVITVIHQSVSNYFKYEKQKPYVPQPKPSFFKKIFTKKRQVNDYYSDVQVHQNKKEIGYKGYLVFNKPMYKPKDTVKFKAYLLQPSGKAIHNKVLKAVLFDTYKRTGNTLKTLNPYREGGYESDFMLADSLNLTLDTEYDLILKEQRGKDWVEVFRNPFRYEDYELKAVNFSVRTDKDKFSPGNPVSIFLKATDENELAIPDGRVEVQVSNFQSKRFYAPKVFIKDTLWTKTILLDPVGETKLVLPDSIFPKADGNFSVHFKFLNSNNESQYTQKQLEYNFQQQSIESALVKDSLKIEYLEGGKSVQQKAWIITSYKEDNQADSVQVSLPVKLKVNYHASGYEVKMEKGYKDQISLSEFQPEITVSARSSRDTLQVLVANLHKIPFWYTIFSDQEVTHKGYTTQLDSTFKQETGKVAHVQVNYRWDDRDVKTSASSVYTPNLLNVKLLAPEVVYPGETVNMMVKVTDMDNAPAAATDVTAYAFTAKFRNVPDPQLPFFGRQYRDRKLKPLIDAEDLTTTGQMTLNWNRWGAALGLDTIEYYKFANPKEIYSIQETSRDSLTLFAPFLTVKGKILPVHLVYVDDVPVYFEQADQLQRYAFKIYPGKHRITLRSSELLVVLEDFEFAKAKKTILSIHADLNNKKAVVTKVKPELSSAESAQLASYMIRINNNFEDNKTVLSTDNSVYLINEIPNLKQNKDLLIGPVAENYLNFKSGSIDQTFIKEPGYTYTILPNLLKQKSFASSYAFQPNLNIAEGRSVEDYTQFPLFRAEIDSIWNDYLDLRSRTSNLFASNYNSGPDYGQLQMELDTSISNHLPYLKNVLIFKNGEPDFLKVYPGNTGYFLPLEAGRYRIIYLFKDNRYLKAEALEIKANGMNHYIWKGLKVFPADAFSLKIDQQIKSVGQDRTSGLIEPVQQAILENVNEAAMVSKFKHIMTGRVIEEYSKNPLPGVYVKIKGLAYAVSTNADGFFEIKVPSKGKVLFSYLGFETKEVAVKNGNVGEVMLSFSTSSLNEVVVVGYGSQRKKDLTGSVVTLTAGILQGRTAGLMVGEAGASAMIRIRGTSTLPMGQKPLIILDGLPFNGNLNVIDPASILSLEVLKDANATAIYGSRAVNGVVIIKTKTGNLKLNAAQELAPQQQTMRNHFSDYAIWQPKLLTDETGTARFRVKFPDDITNWNTRLIAMNGNKQSGTAQTNIKSFKTLSANFVSPTFALEGDSINVIGKLLNYGTSEEEVNRKFRYNGKELLNNQVKFKNSKIDTITIVAQRQTGSEQKQRLSAGSSDTLTAANGIVTNKSNLISRNAELEDSLRFEYTLQQSNGYFDGESRQIQLLATGVKETKGYFSALNSDTTVRYDFPTAYGKVTLHAESSVFPVLLSEMDRISSYEYFCNEQLASKLKALLLEKTVRKYLGENFKGEKRIKELIRLLGDNKRAQGTWGWWKDSSEELWISLHVVESLLQAEKQGYTVVLDRVQLNAYLLNRLDNRPDQDQIYALKILHALNKDLYLKDFIVAIEKNQLSEEKRTETKKSVYENLSLLRLKQMAGVPVDLKALMSLKKQTMFGNSYWGENNNRFWDNSTQNTILAYQILKTSGSAPAELDRIRQYFFEQRMDGQWRNTYESSLILETILPDLIKPNQIVKPATIALNQESPITRFPFHKVIDPIKLSVSKTGDAPVYFTAYQQFLNTRPVKVDKDFKVKTWFDQNNAAVKKLKAGAVAILNIEVEVRADADYVMIEVPIPAGCSYENKNQSYFGKEVHREYAKDKTSIFCSKLKQGKYNFTIQLMPRYSGSYTLNPAKAEMMYFPVFYGREGLKRITIQ